MIESSVVELDDELKALQQQWLAMERNKQDEFYATQFAPLFVKQFAELELQGASPLTARPRYLVSVLGLSWQPVALMASWVKPERMLVIATQESVRKGETMSESPVDRIARIGQIPARNLELKIIDEHQEEEIYRVVRDFVRHCGIHPSEVAIDPTGGKKSMSVTAALAGFMSGCQLVYVDYGVYHNRIPLAGTEFPRALMNPLDVFGDAEFEKIESAYNEGNFREAARRAAELAARPSRQRAKAELFEAMCNAFDSWSGFEFENAKGFLSKALGILDQAGHVERWTWARSLRNKLSNLYNLFEKVCTVCSEYETAAANNPQFMQGAILLVLNHLACARRSAQQGRYGIAGLLAYSTLEKYIDLLLLTHFGLNDDDPDFSTLSLDIDRFHGTGRKIFGRGYKPSNLAGQKISLSLGYQLAGTLLPSLFPSNPARILGTMQARNKCEYEHGIVSRPLDAKTADAALEYVAEVVSLHFGSGVEARTMLESQLAEFEFPSLPVH